MAQPPRRSPMIPGILARATIAGPASTTANSARKLKAAPSGRCNARIGIMPVAPWSGSRLGPDQGDVVVGAPQRRAEPPLRQPADRPVRHEGVDGGIERLVV